MSTYAPLPTRSSGKEKQRRYRDRQYAVVMKCESSLPPPRLKRFPDLAPVLDKPTAVELAFGEMPSSLTDKPSPSFAFGVDSERGLEPWCIMLVGDATVESYIIFVLFPTGMDMDMDWS
jgi:hypothetical protein